MVNEYRQKFIITSNISRINFNVQSDSCKKLKVSKVAYTTASVNNDDIMIYLSGFTPNVNTYTNTSGSNYNYLSKIDLRHSALAEVRYFNYDTNNWDIDDGEKRIIASHQLCCLINNDSSIQDISDSNPLVIEFTYQI
jgi:hypothetical protein